MKWLLLVTMIMAFLEVVGVASILPFMQLASNPESINENEFLLKLYNFTGFTSYTSMLVFTGVSVIVLLLVSNIFNVFTIWLQHKFSWEAAHNISSRLLKSYLNRPYAFFLDKNTSELQAKIVMEVGQICSSILIPLSDMAARFLVVIVIFSLLVFVDPKAALISGVVLCTTFVIAFLLKKGVLQKLGKERLEINLRRFKSMSEALHGIKSMKVYSAQQFFYQRFFKASKAFSLIQPRVQLISVIPKAFIEVLAFGGIIAFTIYLLTNGGDLQKALPILSLYAVAGYRLMPSLQRIFASATKIRHAFPVVDSVHADLNYVHPVQQEKTENVEILNFSQKIQLSNVGFKYIDKDLWNISNLDFEITKGQTVAFVGSTGSGKTTLVDLIVGLLEATEGEILIDDLPLRISNANSWYAQLGYVQQDVFLFDASIKSNIAIGVPVEEVNMDRIIEVAKIANIHNFINDELEDQYDTEIGERGVRLSGGQQQRLGLARALYKNPSVLILDEATSALDGVTESKVMDSLKKHTAGLTIIIIAHRLSTVRQADCICLLDKGKITAQGPYEELVNSSSIFKEMAELS